MHQERGKPPFNHELRELEDNSCLKGLQIGILGGSDNFSGWEGWLAPLVSSRYRSEGAHQSTNGPSPHALVSSHRSVGHCGGYSFINPRSLQRSGRKHRALMEWSWIGLRRRCQCGSCYLRATWHAKNCHRFQRAFSFLESLPKEILDTHHNRQRVCRCPHGRSIQLPKTHPNCTSFWIPLRSLNR